MSQRNPISLLGCAPFATALLAAMLIAGCTDDATLYESPDEKNVAVGAANPDPVGGGQADFDPETGLPYCD